jgi:nucleoid DNA-binding protein
MNNKLLFQDLTDQLAEAGKIKKKDAEEFLRAFFKVFEESLFQGDVVKIAGLGAFKLLMMDARKSVNVSTGEEFEIKEHYKLSFVPDAELKKSVNKPYAHLEPVELDAALDANPVPFEKQSATSPQKIIKGNNIKGKTIEKEIAKDLKPKPEKAEMKKEKKTAAEGEKATRKSKRGIWLWFLFFAVIVLLGVWSWFSNEAQKKEDAISLREMELIDSLESDANLRNELADIQNDIHQETKEGPMGEDGSGTAETTLDVTKAAVPAKAATKTSTEVAKQAKSEPQVDKPTPKTQAPLLATVVLKSGQRLTTLSLKYYGHKAFWVYIYQANKNVISNPDNIQIGTILRIPKPDPKLINPNNPTLVAKAKALQYQILGH